MRPRSETIGKLGRAPARASRQPPNQLPPQSPPPGPDRGALRRWIRGALLDNLGIKFLSIVLAVTVFLLVNTDRDHEIIARVGVSYTLPDDKVLVSERIEEVRITIKGPWQRLRRFDPRKLDRINLDLRRAPAGDFAITRGMLDLPPGLTITEISPSSVNVAFDRRVEKIVEITPQVVDRPQHGYVVSEVKPAPATIKVRGAEVTLAALSAIHTRDISVDGRAETFLAETEAVPSPGVEIEGSPRVAVTVTVDEQLVTRRTPGLVVTVRGEGIDPAKWAVTPSQVEISLTGTMLAVEKAKAVLTPMVKITPDGKTREVEVTLEGLPPGIGVKISPERVKVAPVKPAAPAPVPTP